MGSDVCEACGEGTVTLDHVYGILACDNCGRVVDDVETHLGAHHQSGHVLERGGTFVAKGDCGARAAGGVAGSGQLQHSFISRDEVKKINVMKKMREIAAILRVRSDRVEDVQFMLEQLMDGEWGQGRWIEVLVGACVYISIRQSRLPLTLIEVAAAIDCSVAELGRMYRRVLHVLKIELPDPDPSIYLERAISSLPPIKELGREMTRKMSKEGGILLECSRRWFITTGRRSLPVVAAVVALVAEANQVKVNFEDIVREVYTNLRTSRNRHRELKRALVGMGQKLPWGKDITVKSLHMHLPFVLQFLEADLKRTKKRKETLPELLPLKVLATRSAVEEHDHLMTAAQEWVPIKESELRTEPPPDCTPGPSGLENMSVELQLVRALRMKEVEWQAWPPAFLASEDSRSRRCVKIDAARERITEAKISLLSELCNFKPESSEPSNSIRKKAAGFIATKKLHLMESPPQETRSALDWEDLLIEYLLLRGVECRQLEDGYYQAALGVHHMQSTNPIDDNELISYLRTKTEVDLLKSLQSAGEFQDYPEFDLQLSP